MNNLSIFNYKDNMNYSIFKITTSNYNSYVIENTKIKSFHIKCKVYLKYIKMCLFLAFSERFVY